MDNDGGLFLMEVLIDKVSFLKSPCFSDKDFRTCVTVTVPTVDPLEICDDEPGQCVAKSGGPFVKTFNSGKSCLFSFKNEDIKNAMGNLPIEVIVYKSLPCGCLPTKIIMGKATIDMTKEFVQLRNKYLEDPANVSCQALKDTFQLVSPEGAEPTGTIVIFLRISCFGKLIITRFHGTGPPSLGPDQGPSIVDRSCNPARQYQTSDEPCVCGATQVAGGKGAHGSGPPCQQRAGSGVGPCPIAQDPWNSKPCDDPDEVCYCSGQRPPPKQPMVCRNMEQYCLHVPKGVLPSLPIFEDLIEEQSNKTKSTNKELKLLHIEDDFTNNSKAVDEYLKPFTDIIESSTESILSELDEANSMCTIMSRHVISETCIEIFSDDVDYVSKSCSHYPNYRKKKPIFMPNSLFGKFEMPVYVTLFDGLCHRRTSATQATSSVNKCLQASKSRFITNYKKNSNLVCNNTNSSSTFDSSKLFVQNNKVIYSDVYLFGIKSEQKGMGSKNKQPKVSKRPSKSSQKPRESNSAAQTSSTKLQVPSDANKQPSYACTCKNIGPKPPKPPKASKASKSPEEPKPPTLCPSTGCVTNGDMMATISHIKIGPRELCPVHGKEPCQGPSCIIAATANEQIPIKVSTVTNARRGVFELVIRRLNGAPLATNELMLEWTPPPCRPTPCGPPCATPCVLSRPSCRSSKCKMIVCRPPRCGKYPCGSPCGKCGGKSCRACKPCRPCVPASSLICRPCPPSPRCRPCPPSPRCRPCPPSPGCRPCSPSPGCRPCPPSPSCRPCPPSPSCRPCPPLPGCSTRCNHSPRCRPCLPFPRCRPCLPRRPCRPCPPRRCRPCPPPPGCQPACPPLPCNVPCGSPCGSPCTPCVRPCPVGYKKRRRIRKQINIRAHRRLTSPCLNKSKTCTMVRCRSFPGPCFVGCCSVPPCPPRKCCSVVPGRPRTQMYVVCSSRKCNLSPCAPPACPPVLCASATCAPASCPPRKCCSKSKATAQIAVPK